MFLVGKGAFSGLKNGMTKSFLFYAKRNYFTSNKKLFYLKVLINNRSCSVLDEKRPYIKS